jgi:hypothetical protein
VNRDGSVNQLFLVTTRCIPFLPSAGHFSLPFVVAEAAQADFRAGASCRMRQLATFPGQAVFPKILKTGINRNGLYLNNKTLMPVIPLALRAVFAHDHDHSAPDGKGMKARPALSIGPHPSPYHNQLAGLRLDY